MRQQGSLGTGANELSKIGWAYGMRRIDMATAAERGLGVASANLGVAPDLLPPDHDDNDQDATEEAA